MTQEPTISFTKSELNEKARRFINASYGYVNETEDKDAWYIRYGMLLDFIDRVSRNMLND